MNFEIGISAGTEAFTVAKFSHYAPKDYGTPQDTLDKPLLRPDQKAAEKALYESAEAYLTQYDAVRKLKGKSDTKGISSDKVWEIRIDGDDREDEIKTLDDLKDALVGHSHLIIVLQGVGWAEWRLDKVTCG
jgi:hypothetical protein